MIDNFLNVQQLFADPERTTKFDTLHIAFYEMKSAKTVANFNHI